MGTQTKNINLGKHPDLFSYLKEVCIEYAKLETKETLHADPEAEFLKDDKPSFILEWEGFRVCFNCKIDITGQWDCGFFIPEDVEVTELDILEVFPMEYYLEMEASHG